MSSSASSHQKRNSSSTNNKTSSSSSSNSTIPVSSARRRLADGLLLEEMENDPTLCVTTPTTIREFLSVLLDFGSVGSNNEQREKRQSQTHQKQQPPRLNDEKDGDNKIQQLHQNKQENIESKKSTNHHHHQGTSANNEGRGALTDDSSNFSKKCDEARVRSVIRAHRIIDQVLLRRHEKQEQFKKEHEMRQKLREEESSGVGSSAIEEEVQTLRKLDNSNNNNNSIDSITSSVLTLSEWKSVVRQHPALLKFSLDRAMPRSETTATAIISDMPVAILPARDSVSRSKMMKDAEERERQQRYEEDSSSDDNDTNNADGNKRNRRKELDKDEIRKEELEEDTLRHYADGEEGKKHEKIPHDKKDQDKNNKKDGSHPHHTISTITSLTHSGWTYANDYWQRGYQWLERFISGGIAGGVAKSVIAPGDRVKIIFQVNAELAFTIAAALNIGKTIVRRNGVFGLWAGHGATLLRVVPYASISFGSFEFYHLSLRGIILNAEELETEIRNSGGSASKSEQMKLDLAKVAEKKANKKRNLNGDASNNNSDHSDDEENSTKNDEESKTLSSSSSSSTNNKPSSSKRQIALRFICGALAGATATAATYPLDLLRARYAAHSLHSTGKPYPSYFIGLKTIYQGEGIRALYSGLGPTLLGIVPYAGASFTVFETLKAFVLSRNAKLREQQQQQQQDSSAGENNNNTNNKNGKTAAALVEETAPPKKQELATWQRLSAGALSGLIAQSLTYPLDIVRRRMQVIPDKSKNMKDTLRLIYKNEGFRGLYKGLTMNWVKGPIAVAVSFTINDWMKSRQQRFHAATALSTATAVDDDDDEDLEGEGKSTSKKSTSTQQEMRKKKNRKTITTKKKRNGEEEEIVVNYDEDLLAITENEFLTENEKKYALQQLQISQQTSITERFVIGGAAGAAAKIWTIPFDRLKLMMALGRVTNDGISPGHQFRTVLRLLLETRNPFQGAAGQLLRVMPFAAVSYTMFDAFQPVARRIVLTKDASFASDMLAGASCAAVATVVAHPLDLIRSKFALAEVGGAPLPFNSYAEGLKVLMKETRINGVSAVLFPGLRPALVGVCPLAAFSFAIYHEGKRRGWAQDGDSFSNRMLLGAGAAIIGQIASYPLNIVRRRAIALAEEEVTESIAHQLRAGLRGDSYSTFAAMYRRMPLGWTLGTMTLAMSFAANDWMRDKLIDVRRKQATELLLRDPTI